MTTFRIVLRVYRCRGEKSMFIPRDEIVPIAKRAAFFLAIAAGWVVVVKTSPLWAGLSL